MPSNTDTPQASAERLREWWPTLTSAWRLSTGVWREQDVSLDDIRCWEHFERVGPRVVSSFVGILPFSYRLDSYSNELGFFVVSSMSERRLLGLRILVEYYGFACQATVLSRRFIVNIVCWACSHIFNPIADSGYKVLAIVSKETVEAFMMKPFV